MTEEGSTECVCTRHLTTTIWIQHGRRLRAHPYDGCSVAHEVRKLDLYPMTPLFFYLANFRFSAPFQWFNLAALLDFNNFSGAIWLKLWVNGGLWRSQKICIHHITAASFTTGAYEKIFEKFGPQHIMWCNYKIWPLEKLASKPGALPGGSSTVSFPSYPTDNVICVLF